jgi:hypothetical protein
VGACGNDDVKFGERVVNSREESVKRLKWASPVIDEQMNRPAR